MAIVDTSPLNYLILTDVVYVLPRLYHQVLIPDEVASELADSYAPPVVVDWARHLPAWVEDSCHAGILRTA